MSALQKENVARVGLAVLQRRSSRRDGRRRRRTSPASAAVGTEHDGVLPARARMHAMLVGALWISVKWNVEPSGAVVVELWAAARRPSRSSSRLQRPASSAAAEGRTGAGEAERRHRRRQEKKAPPKSSHRPTRRRSRPRNAASTPRSGPRKRSRSSGWWPRRNVASREEATRPREEEQAEAAERKRDDERREAVRKAEEARMLAQAAGGSPAGNARAASAADRAAPPPPVPAAGIRLCGSTGRMIRPRIVFACRRTRRRASMRIPGRPAAHRRDPRVRKLKASGLPGYDEAVERAIRRTDPFPAGATARWSARDHPFSSRRCAVGDLPAESRSAVTERRRAPFANRLLQTRKAFRRRCRATSSYNSPPMSRLLAHAFALLAALLVLTPAGAQLRVEITGSAPTSSRSRSPVRAQRRDPAAGRRDHPR